MESHDSKASFLLFREFSAFVSIRFYSVLDRIHPFSLGDKWASNAKFAVGIGRHGDDGVVVPQKLRSAS